MVVTKIYLIIFQYLPTMFREQSNDTDDNEDFEAQMKVYFHNYLTFRVFLKLIFKLIYSWKIYLFNNILHSHVYTALEPPNVILSRAPHLARPGLHRPVHTNTLWSL